MVVDERGKEIFTYEGIFEESVITFVIGSTDGSNFPIGAGGEREREDDRRLRVGGRENR